MAYEAKAPEWLLLVPGGRKRGPFDVEDLIHHLTVFGRPPGLRIRRVARAEWTAFEQAASVYPELLDAGVVFRPSNRGARVAGHEDYRRFLEVAGPELSPMFPARVPFELGGYRFWTVEGIWQGTKVIRLNDESLVAVDGTLRPGRLPSAGTYAYWFPAAGLVREDFKRSRFFQLLKSGKKYHRHRNRVFGLGNWQFDGHHDPRTGERIDGRSASASLHAPFYLLHLAQYPEALERLRRLNADGRVAITGRMERAHPHLGLLRALLGKRP